MTGVTVRHRFSASAERVYDAWLDPEKARRSLYATASLPMGAHDPSKWTDKHMKAFERFVHEQGALASVLRVAAARDEHMLASIQQKPV